MGFFLGFICGMMVMYFVQLKSDELWIKGAYDKEVKRRLDTQMKLWRERDDI